jgi:hypothetical protein
MQENWKNIFRPDAKTRRKNVLPILLHGEDKLSVVLCVEEINGLETSTSACSRRKMRFKPSPIDTGVKYHDRFSKTLIKDGGIAERSFLVFKGLN